MSRDQFSSTAPRWAEWLLSRVAPPERTVDVIGDLEEEHRRRVRARGRAVAAVITALDTLDVAVALLRERRRLGRAERLGGGRRRMLSTWLDAFTSDASYAARGLRANPGFATAVVATLALGIGVNAAIFPIVDRLLFRLPPMLAAPELTHRVYLALPTPDGAEQFFPEEISYPYYQTFRRETKSFARTAQYTDVIAVVGTGSAMRELPIGIVSGTFFSFFDAPPALGRYFGPADDRPPAGAPVAVLRYDTWQSRYGGKPDVIGSTLRIGSSIYTIIGVAPRGFVGILPENPPVAFVPTAAWQAASFAASGRKGSWWTSQQINTGTLLVQRRSDIELRAANADLTKVMAGIWAEWMGGSGLNTIARYKPSAMAASLLSERGPNRTRVAQVSALVGGMAVIVLLIACANVANLHLARAMRRRREIAVRLALGVSTRRLLSQLVSESVMLSVVGGVVGLAAGQLVGQLLRGIFTSGAAPAPLLDSRTIAFTACALLATGILAAIGPALMARGYEVTRHLRAGVRGRVERSRLRVSLLVLQTALSVLLLVGAGLFARSLANVRHQPLGFDPTGLLYVETRMADVRLPPAERTALRLRLLETARRLPLVEQAALTGSLPISDIAWGNLRVPGIDSMTRMRMPDFYQNSVGAGYFAAMRTRILRGRPIDVQDAAGASKAVVVSNGLAKLLWPGQEALGKCVYVANDSTCTFVVGVAEDIRASLKAGDAVPYYYVATAQNRPDLGRGLLLRMQGDPAAQVERVRAALQREMPGASYVTVAPYERIIDNAAHAWRLGATMFALFAALAVALAAIGLYGVITYDVAQRTHEIGVRMAVGARVSDVLWLVLREGLAIGAGGVLIGTAITLAGAGRIAALLFGISARDPVVYALVGVSMLVVATVASLAPAHRAASVDPNTALRAE